MMRTTDQGTIAIEKTVCYSFQEEGHTRLCRTTWGSTRVSQGVEGVRRKPVVGAFILVSMGMARQGRVSRVRIGWFE